MIMINTQNLTNFEQGITSLAKALLNLDIKSIIFQYNELYSYHTLHKGKGWSINRLKALYLYSARYVQKQNPRKIPKVKSTKSGFPKEILFVKDLLDGSYIHKRIGLSILNSYRDKFLDKPNEDLSKVTSKGPVTKESRIYTKVKEFINGSIQNPFTKKMTFEAKLRWHCTGKRGPNGLRQSLFCHVDAASLRNNPSLKRSIIDLSRIIHGKESITFIETMEKMESFFWEGYETTPTPIDSRLALLLEGGGKTRTVAMGDFFSQNVLKPIHDLFMKRLKSIKQDGTYDQESASLAVMNRTKDHGVYCYDLEGATERFPSLIQQLVVGSCLGEEIAQLWYNLMTDRTFVSSIGDAKYMCGQPMGLYSSWAVFSLSHHVIVQLSAKEAGFTLPFSGYRLLGDDIAIFDHSVARCYEQNLKELGVSVSQAKTLIPQEGNSNHTGEFCKRIFLNGKEFTPLTPDILKIAVKDENLITLVLRYLKERGWLPETDSHCTRRYSCCYFEIYENIIFHFYHNSYKRNKARKLAFFPASMDYINGGEDNIPSMPPWNHFQGSYLRGLYSGLRVHMLQGQLRRQTLNPKDITYDAGEYRHNWGLNSLEEFYFVDITHPLYAYFNRAYHEVDKLQSRILKENIMILDDLEFIPDINITEYRMKIIRREQQRSKIIMELFRGFVQSPNNCLLQGEASDLN